MRRDIMAPLVGLSIILLVPSSLAQSTVELGGSISMSGGDMGIEGISVSENQDLILAHGANSGDFPYRFQFSRKQFTHRMEW